jgi:hypothetical protein
MARVGHHYHWLIRAIFWWKMPREIVAGRGEIITGHGVKDGRAFAFIRPVSPGGKPGTTPAGMEHGAIFSPRRGDTVIWLDGRPDGLIDAIRVADARRRGWEPSIGPATQSWKDNA